VETTMLASSLLRRATSRAASTRPLKSMSFRIPISVSPYSLFLFNLMCEKVYQILPHYANGKIAIAIAVPQPDAFCEDPKP
jgi:hypothetical protein